MMQTGRYAVLATVLLALLLLCGYTRQPEQTATAQNPDNQSSATQLDANAAAPDSNASNASPSPSANAPAANSRAGVSQQLAFSPLVIPAGTSITVHLHERLSSASAAPGERFDAVIDEPVVVDNRVVVPFELSPRHQSILMIVT